MTVAKELKGKLASILAVLHHDHSYQTIINQSANCVPKESLQFTELFSSQTREGVTRLVSGEAHTLQLARQERFGFQLEGGQ